MRQSGVKLRLSPLPTLVALILLYSTVAKTSAPAADDCTTDLGAAEDIFRWANSSGIQFNNIEAGGALEVRGVVATANIQGGSVIVSLPRRLALSVSPGQSCPVPDLIPEDVWSGAPKYFQLALLLLSELKKGSQSQWHPYIQTLPHHFDTLVHWSDSELEQLQYGNTKPERQFLNEAKQQLDDIKELYEQVRWAWLVTQLNSTLQDLVWASDIVRSRAFAIATTPGWLTAKNIGIAAFAANAILRIPFFSEYVFTQRIIGICRSVTFVCIGAILFTAQTENTLDLALLPVIDAINHNSSSLGYLQPGRSGASLTIDAYIGPQGAKAGDEVTAAYATATNEILLQHYGFVDMHNVNDEYTANILDFIEETVIEQPNEEQLHAVRADPKLSEALSEAKLTAKGWSPDTRQALRFLFASRAEFSAAQSWNPVRWVTHAVQHQQVPPAGYAFSRQQSADTETRIDQVLGSFCQDVSKAKPTSLGQDIKALEQIQLDSHSSTHRQKLALQFRISYKRLLQECIDQHTTA